MRIIFHIDMDAFFASCEEAVNPKLRGRPLIVGGNKEDKRGIVACPNYLARAKGVRTAMPLSKAIQLCPEANYIRSTRGLYSDYSKKVRNIFYKYTPMVQPVSVDEAFMDVTDVLHAYKNDYIKLAKELKAEIKNTLDITATIGVASTKLCAKMASKIQKPDGLTVMPLGKEKDFIKNLPIENIPGVGKSSQARLKKYGINLIGDILKYEKDFYESLGMHTDFLFNVANAKTSDKVNFEGEDDRKSLSKENTFWEDTNDMTFLKSELYSLMEKACYRLRQENTVAKTITVKIKYTDFKVNQKSFTRTKYSNMEKDYYDDAVRLLEMMMAGRRKIRLLGVKFSELEESDNTYQEELFTDVDKEKNLVEKIDLLRSKYNFGVLSYGKNIKK
ncbi:MAG: DNA polymerase IV [Ignavibacteria bacterium]|nr:DNA polymerase IV [Ignavibacteria bacterium]